MTIDRCHECDNAASEQCVRCGLRTCEESFYEREHLGLCQCCRTAIVELGLPLTDWPYPLRKPFTESTDVGGR